MVALGVSCFPFLEAIDRSLRTPTFVNPGTCPLLVRRDDIIEDVSSSPWSGRRTFRDLGFDPLGVSGCSSSVVDHSLQFLLREFMNSTFVFTNLAFVHFLRHVHCHLVIFLGDGGIKGSAAHVTRNKDLTSACHKNATRSSGH